MSSLYGICLLCSQYVLNEVTPESILNGVQYSATQIMYNATSGHAVIYVGPLRWSFGNFHGCSRGNIIWLGV